ncbi:MAG: hypothetical protein JWO03_221 [Bacteroidetes bacterium]|nr:hypothetical protein [Bacteroidota bacterium]
MKYYIVSLWQQKGNNYQMSAKHTYQIPVRFEGQNLSDSAFRAYCRYCS